MTDEQIKQNAETAYPGFEDLQTVYIEGAHSRDEEIKELNGQVALHKDRADYYHDLYMKLRNPWISVEERLPDDMQKVIWVRKDGQYFFGHFHNHDNGRLYFVSTEAVTDVTGEWRDRVTHWMPIPEVKKGELEL